MTEEMRCAVILGATVIAGASLLLMAFFWFILTKRPDKLPPLELIRALFKNAPWWVYLLILLSLVLGVIYLVICSDILWRQE